MKQHIRYNAAIAVCAALAVLLIVLLITSVNPSCSSLGIEVKETIRVSSSLDGDSDGYRSQLRGMIVNQNDERVTVEKLKIVVGNGKDEREITLTDIVLEPRVAYDLASNGCEWEDTAAYDRVLSVIVVCKDGTEQLANNTIGLAVNLTTLLWGVLTVIDGILLVFLAKQRYYLAQEARLKKE